MPTTRLSISYDSVCDHLNFSISSLKLLKGAWNGGQFSFGLKWPWVFHRELSCDIINITRMGPPVLSVKSGLSNTMSKKYPTTGKKGFPLYTKGTDCREWKPSRGSFTALCQSWVWRLQLFLQSAIYPSSIYHHCWWQLLVVSLTLLSINSIDGKCRCVIAVK